MLCSRVRCPTLLEIYRLQNRYNMRLVKGFTDYIKKVCHRAATTVGYNCETNSCKSETNHTHMKTYRPRCVKLGGETVSAIR